MINGISRTKSDGTNTTKLIAGGVIIVGIAGLVGTGAELIWLAANDVFGIGAVDDALIPVLYQLLSIFGQCFSIRRKRISGRCNTKI